MGVAISGWELVRAVSLYSKPGKEVLGTGSGTAADRILANLLKQGGKKANEICRVLRNSDKDVIRETGERIIEKYFKKISQGIPVFTVTPSRSLIELTICANYAFVTLAKEGHSNPVSMNYLEKIAMPHLFAIYGAMLAEVDFITIGAGIVLQIPPIINAYLNGTEAIYKIPVIGSEDYTIRFDPEAFFGKKIKLNKKPGFLPIVASNTLAKMLEKKLPGEICGFVVEEDTAGGHNAPPRDKVTQTYGERDRVNYQELNELGLPFWIGGSYASPEGLKRAIELGAKGIQAGSVFALSEDSGMDSGIRRKIRRLGFNEELKVITDMRASPTGFPFKVANIPGTVSEHIIYEERQRVCDQSALVSLYKRPDGSIGYRCASEPVDDFVRKGGKIEDTVGRKCICNGLLMLAGLQQVDNVGEPMIVTLGDDTKFLQSLMKNQDSVYGAKNALDYLFGEACITYEK